MSELRIEKDNKNLVTRGHVEIIKLDLNQGQWELKNAEQIREIKNEFIENYFVRSVVKYDKPKHGKLIDVVFEPATEKSKNFFQRLWTANSFRFDEYEEFLGEEMGAVATAVIIYDLEQNIHNWENIGVAGTAENDLIHAYINKAVERQIQAYTNFIEETERINSNEYVERLMSSLDELLASSDGEVYTRHEVISEESSLTFNNNYHKSKVVTWFEEWLEENKRLRSDKNRAVRSQAELTSHQLIFYDVMRHYYLGSLVSNLEDNRDIYKDVVEKRIENNERIYTPQDIYSYIMNIRKSANKAYKEAFPEEITYLELQHIEDKKILNEFLELVKNDDNLMLSEWLVGNIDKPVIFDLIYDELESDEVEEIIAFKNGEIERIKGGTLYKMWELVENRLVEIEVTDYAAVKFYKKDKEFISGDKAKNIAEKTKRDAKEKELKELDMKIYKNGELVEVVAYEDLPKPKSYTVSRVLSNGTVIEIDVNSDEYY